MCLDLIIWRILGQSWNKSFVNQFFDSHTRCHLLKETMLISTRVNVINNNFGTSAALKIK